MHRGAGVTFAAKKLVSRITRRFRANPRIKPPYFPALGAYQCPTIVNNVETLCDVKHVIEMGGEGLPKLVPGNTGTRIWCVSGTCKADYEFVCDNAWPAHFDVRWAQTRTQ